MLVHILHGAAIALLSLSSSALISSDTIVATSFEDLDGTTRHPSTHVVVNRPWTPPWPSPPSASSTYSQLLVATTTTATTTTTADDAAVLLLPLPPLLPSSSCSSRQQYDTADDIPPSSYETKEVILGRVVKVIDGDTIRIRHVPVVPPSCPHDDVSTNDDGGGIEEDRGGSCGDGSGRLTQCTVIVRLYGVDAPEISRKKTGDVVGGGQPYSREAKDYVVDVAYGKLAKVKLLGKDRYGRVLGRVSIVGAGDTAPPSEKEEEEDLSVGLLEGGYAKLYVGGGARYDGRRRELEERMAKARDERRGMWADGGVLPVSADSAAYKRGMRARDKD
jgi:endonuclease YncB( thermonuclease family)